MTFICLCSLRPGLELRGHAAVDEEQGARDVRGVIPREKDCGAADLFRAAEAAEQLSPLHRVSTHPGQIAFTRIPATARSIAASRVSAATPPFDAAYGAVPPTFWTEWTEAM